MPIYQIEFRKDALKFLKTRNIKDKKRILSAIYKLPDCSNIKKMEGYTNRYRLRIGSIRVIYDKFDNIMKIIVIAIGNRGNIYK
jgi:mRNA interferase RelE/StbE